MKKEYIKPIISVTKIGYESCLLAGSPEQIGEGGETPDPPTAPQDPYATKGTNTIWDDWDD